MNQEELLQQYLKKLQEKARELMVEEQMSALEALRLALNYIEGEMHGY